MAAIDPKRVASLWFSKKANLEPVLKAMMDAQKAKSLAHELETDMIDYLEYGKVNSKVSKSTFEEFRDHRGKEVEFEIPTQLSITGEVSLDLSENLKDSKVEKKSLEGLAKALYPMVEKALLRGNFETDVEHEAKQLDLEYDSRKLKMKNHSPKISHHGVQGNKISFWFSLLMDVSADFEPKY